MICKGGWLIYCPPIIHFSSFFYVLSCFEIAHHVHLHCNRGSLKLQPCESLVLAAPPETGTGAARCMAAFFAWVVQPFQLKKTTFPSPKLFKNAFRNWFPSFERWLTPFRSFSTLFVRKVPPLTDVSCGACSLASDCSHGWSSSTMFDNMDNINTKT